MQDKYENKAQDGLVRPGRKKIPWFLLLRLTGIVLFIVIISRTDLQALWSWMNQARPSYLVLAILLQVILLLVKALRWHLLNGESFRSRFVIQRFGEFFESYAIGVVTPGRLGELMKAGHAGTKQGILGAGLRVVSERGLDFGIFILLAGLAILLDFMPGVQKYWGIPVTIAGASVFLFSVLILTSPQLIRWVKNLAHRLRPGLQIEHEARSRNATLRIILLTLLSNFSYFCSSYLLAAGVGISAGFLWVSGGIALAGLINTIPVTIMGLGTRELTFLYVFKAFPAPQVLAFSGLVFMIAQAGGGVISLILGQVFLYKSRKSRIRKDL